MTKLGRLGTILLALTLVAVTCDLGGLCAAAAMEHDECCCGMPAGAHHGDSHDCSASGQGERSAPKQPDKAANELKTRIAGEPALFLAGAEAGPTLFGPSSHAAGRGASAATPLFLTHCALLR